MSTEAIIISLLSVIGVLIGVVCGLYVKNISEKFDSISQCLNELKMMFTDHIKDDKIHTTH